jgi:hypothetical protein
MRSRWGDLGIEWKISFAKGTRTRDATLYPGDRTQAKPEMGVKVEVASIERP